MRSASPAVNKEEKSRRQTAQRALVLEVVRSLHNHPTSAEVFNEARCKHESISRATVYRNLDVLVQSGQLMRIEVPQAAARYDATTAFHGHAVCRECGAISDVALNEAELIENFIKEDHGFKIEGWNAVFEGLCKECASK